MKLVLYLVWSLFTVAMVWSVIHTVWKAKTHKRLTASWPKAHGRVTGSKKSWFFGAGDSSDSVRHWPLYEFVGADGAVYTGESKVVYSNVPVLGSALLVAYNPADPRESFQVARESKLIPGCIFPFFVGLCIAGFYIIGYLPLD